MRIASFSTIHNNLIMQSNNSTPYVAASALAGKKRKTQSLNHAFKTSPTVHSFIVCIIYTMYFACVGTVFACKP